MKKFCLSLFALYCTSVSFAQELNCKVNVQISPKLNSSNLGDKGIFESLRKSIYEFMNSYKFTNDVFKREEQIDCTFSFTIDEFTGNNTFKGQLQVQARRPVYRTDYGSILINYLDEDIDFIYNEDQAIDFSDNTYISNLASTLGFYAYYIIGTDYDAFSLNGGTPYFQKAQQIVGFTNSALGKTKGWDPTGKTNNRNRYWMIDNILNGAFKEMREASYTHHRLGLDMMYDKMEEGKGNIFKSLEFLQKVHKTRPLSFPMNVYMTAKKDEFIGIFSQTNPEEKQRAVTILSQIDPTNTDRYRQILK